jgi:hypothetical protein
VGICNEEKARWRGCEMVGLWGFASIREESYFYVSSLLKKKFIPVLRMVLVASLPMHSAVCEAFFLCLL